MILYKVTVSQEDGDPNTYQVWASTKPDAQTIAFGWGVGCPYEDDPPSPTPPDES